MSYSASLILLCLISTTIIVGADDNNPTVKIKYGEIVGEILKSTNGRDYSAFIGIPYAKPPIGDLRFEKPEPIEPWEGTLQASRNNSKVCPQSHLFTQKLIGDEDCLYINVYTPEIEDSEEEGVLPVMVFIHGGGFFGGSGTFQEYGPHRLMDRDVVLVTFNYRLGALGFLATSDEAFPGNYGLLDQIAALKWVQENIEAFGGDKSKVTIFGESAGAVSVTYLMISPLAKGLFHGAIAQSGTAMCSGVQNPHPSTCTKFFAVKLCCKTFPIEAMKNCLKNKTWTEILTASKGSEIFPGVPMPFKPNVDNNVIPEDPISMFREGKLSQVPVIIGINKDEGAGVFAAFRHWYPRSGEDYLKEDLPELLPIATDMRLYAKIDQVIPKIRQRYFTDVDLTNKTAFTHTMIKVYGDAMFSCAQHTARYIANSTGHPTYVYTFTYNGNNSLLLSESGEDLGVSHADDLQYLFYSSLFPTWNLPEEDREMSEVFLSLWSNFAAHGNPTPRSGGTNMSFVWPAYESTEPKCINLDVDSEVTDQCEPENTDLWVEEIPKLFENAS